MGDSRGNYEGVADEDYTYTNENSKSPPPTGNNNKEEYDDGDILSSKTSEPQDVTLEDGIKIRNQNQNIQKYQTSLSTISSELKIML